MSILIDLMGRARGKETGRGGPGQRLQGPGTIMPCAAALAALANNSPTDSSKNRSFKGLIISSLTTRKSLPTLLSGIERGRVPALARFIETVTGICSSPKRPLLIGTGSSDRPTTQLNIIEYAGAVDRLLPLVVLICVSWWWDYRSSRKRRFRIATTVT